MLKERVPVGSKISFCNMECKVQKVLSDVGLCVTMPMADDEILLLPLYMQSTCFLEGKDGTYRTKGEIVERYKDANGYIMEIELKEGLYKIQESAIDVFCKETREKSIEEQKKLVENAVFEG